VAGISESIDLDITAALARVKQLESAIDRAAVVSVKTEGTGGLGAASNGLRNISNEAKAAEGAAAIATKGLRDLATTAAGQLSPALAGVVGHVTEVGGAALSAAGPVAALTVAGLILGKMALSGVKEFIDLATQVRTFQRVAGGSAEEASRMVAAFNALGVPIQAGSTAILRFSENIRKHSDVLQADGIAIARNKLGQVDIAATLLNVSDAYRKAGDQIDKTKVIVDTFGLRGKALIPVLAAGREQLEEFFAAAERHHEILSQGDLDKARSYQFAIHDLSESFAGLERELGGGLIPLLTGVAKGITGIVEVIDKTANLGVGAAKIVNHLTGVGDALFAIGHASNEFVKETGDDFHKLGEGVTFVADHVPGVVRGFLGIKSSSEQATHAIEMQLASTKKLDDAAVSLSIATNVNVGRIKELADTMGIDLGNATDKEAKALQTAAEKLAAAVTPTERLADAQSVLSDRFATTSEEVKAFKDALDATVGEEASVEEKFIATRDAVRSLGEELGKGRAKGEDLLTFNDQVSSKLLGVVRALQAEEQELVLSGKLSADSGAQQAFLRNRLADLEAAFPGLKGQIEQFIDALGRIPKVEDITIALHTLQVAGGTSELGDRAFLQAGKFQARAEQAATEAAKALADKLGGPESLSQIGAAGEKAGKAAAAGAVKAVEKTLLLSAKPGQGLDLFGFVVKGIDDSVAVNKIKANNAVLSLLDGMKSVVDKAKVIDPEEALGILQAVANVQKASKDLTDTRKKLGANAIETKIAELALKDAQAQVNTKLEESVSASKQVADAQKLQKDASDKLKASNEALRKSISDGLSATLASLSAVRSLAAAQRSLRDAQQSVTDLQKRQAELPTEIAAAQAKVTAEKANSARVTNTEALAIVNARESVASAEKNLDTIRAGSVATVDDLVELTLRLKDAREKLTAAEADAAGNTADVQTAQSGLDAARLTLVPSVVAAAEQKLTDARAAAAAKDTQFKLAEIDARKNVTTAEKALADATAGSTASADDLQKASLEVAVAREQLVQLTKDSTAATSEQTDAETVLKNLQDEQIQVQKDLQRATEDVVDAQLAMVGAQQQLIEGAQNIVGSRDAMIAYFQALAVQAGLTKGQVADLVTMLDNARRLATTPLKGAPAGGPGTIGSPGVGGSFIDPSTGRTAVTGPNGEGGLVAGDPRLGFNYDPSTGQVTSKIPGIVSYTNPYTGELTYYVPGQNIQPGNQAAIDAAKRAQTPNIAPVTPNIGVDPSIYNAQPITWNVYPQTAVFDEKTAGTYMQNMELLYA
jgi:hypothetical protein